LPIRITARNQYTSLVYGTYAKQSGIDLSMGSIGDPWDNALAESFFAWLEKELLRRERFATPRTGPAPDLLVHRVLLQPPPQALQPRHAQPDRPRTAAPTGGHRGLEIRCQRKRVISRTCRRPPTTSVAAATGRGGVEDERLLARIRELHTANYYAYGYRRMWKALLRASEQAPRCRVQRLIRDHVRPGEGGTTLNTKSTRPN
jgi:transposase InsO family protein